MVMSSSIDDGLSVPTHKSSRLGRKPCDRCRKLHLKCIYDELDTTSSCRRCDKTGHDCFLGTKKTKFRNAIFPSANTKTARQKSARKIIRVTTEADTPGADAAKETAKVAEDTTAELDPSEDAEIVLDSEDVEPASKTNHGPEFLGGELTSPEVIKDATSMGFHQRISSDSAVTGEIGNSTNTTTSNPGLQYAPEDSLGLIPDNERRNSFSTRDFQLPKTLSTHDKAYMEYILLRYFYEELAPFCDWCDPDRHFATVVPQKIRKPGPLRSAILTFAARHLSRNVRCRDPDGNMSWRGYKIPDTKEELPMLYHNECIHNIIRFTSDATNMQDETLLAAVIILRTDEEIGFNTEGEEEDQQLFLNIANVIINAQLPRKLALPHTSLTTFDAASPSSHSIALSALDDEGDLGAAGLRQSCIWTALRQDMHAAMTTQKPVRFPLKRCEPFRRLNPASDGVWANRMVTLCADVVEFAFGSDSCDGVVLPAYQDEQRWRSLHEREIMLTATLPKTFQPAYHDENVLIHSIFPEIWYVNQWAICGVTYVELARLLLELFNPTRPSLGRHGFKKALESSIEAAKQILIRLCGVALTNDHCSPSLINACLGISIVGEHFESEIEQEGLLHVLNLMYDRHAYQSLSSKIAYTLKHLWSGE